MIALASGAIIALNLQAFGKQPAQGRAKSAAEASLVRHLRQKIRHVFVIYQENRSFDSYFGTFPGADNLATAQARRHGFRQYDPITKSWVRPFPLITADVADPHHLRPDLLAKANHGRMDDFVAAEEQHDLRAGTSRRWAGDLGLLTMAHEDCRTIPFLWRYAHRFALYDHIFQAMFGPSTPGNIDLIAAQTGQTQWAQHPSEADNHADLGPGEPVIDDQPPRFGPYSDGVPSQRRQLDQTYATVLLTLEGQMAGLARHDDESIRKDIGELTRQGRPTIPWGWYQEGFGNGHGNYHPAYVFYHDAPQYFGYIRKNPPLWDGVHGLRAFFHVLAGHHLPRRSVSFIKAGRMNPFGLRPALQAPFVQAHFRGDDDHPGYSDAQLSEALVARAINAIAASLYWRHAAIFILWDDSGGFYDHVPPPRFERCPDQHPCGDGPRIPALLISPYARSGAVVHQPGDQASFAKFLDVLFKLAPLATLPDEKPYLPEGPRDANPRLGNLTHGFDAARLAGQRPLLAASWAEIPAATVNTVPPPMSCRQTGVMPVAVPGGWTAPPKGFNPLPNVPRSR